MVEAEDGPTFPQAVISCEPDDPRHDDYATPTRQ